MARVGDGDSSGACHLFDAKEGFESAEENRPGFAFALARDVETVVITVDEVNVGIAGRAEEN